MNAVKKSPKQRLPIDKMNSNDIAAVFREMINAKKEYEITKETEATKRQAILADYKLKMQKLSDRRELITEVLQQEYSLRKETINKMFDEMKQAYEDGNTDIVLQAMKSVEGIVKESPLKDLIMIGRALEGDSELEI